MPYFKGPDCHILHIHIPKTGGTSINYYLSEKYGIPLNDNTRLNSELVYSKNTIKCSELFSGVGYEPSQCLAKNKDELVANLDWSKDTLNNLRIWD